MHITLIVLFFLILSCKSREKKALENQYDVLSFLVNRYAKPDLPPPPPGKSYSLSQQEKDSINGQYQVLSIYPVATIVNNIGQKNVNDNEFNTLIQKLNKEKRIVLDITKIKAYENYALTLLDTLKLKQDRRHIEKNFDKLLSFSPISFNNNYTKARRHAASLKMYFGCIFLTFRPYAVLIFLFSSRYNVLLDFVDLY